MFSTSNTQLTSPIHSEYHTYEHIVNLDSKGTCFDDFTIYMRHPDSPEPEIYIGKLSPKLAHIMFSIMVSMCMCVTVCWCH